MLSAYERWTWERCGERILLLKQRLGYGERLWILGFELLDDGRLIDPYQGVEVFDPAKAGPAREIPLAYSAVPEMYCLLHRYAAAEERPLSGEWVSLAAVDRVQRPGLPSEDCDALLGYATKDLRALASVEVPFIGERAVGGDLAFEVWPLPRVRMRLTLWRGDEEVAAGTDPTDPLSFPLVPIPALPPAGLLAAGLGLLAGAWRVLRRRG